MSDGREEEAEALWTSGIEADRGNSTPFSAIIISISIQVEADVGVYTQPIG